ncbi:hypothetical protein [uncultured Sphingomonas sp.]|uniref:hypothetical protein n=1 Tax=uncultured Sphingomonas sp. TaxID=158754 RepID=UPI0025D7BBF6|nr:hypothetical protein [uncultured Sphingomonas sp.]
MKSPPSAGTAFASAYDGHGRFNQLETPFVCPYPDCRVYAQHYWGSLHDVKRQLGGTVYTGRQLKGAEIVVAQCGSCKREAVFLDGRLAKPVVGEAPPPVDDMPATILSDYHEAAAILPGSPRAAAALLRLAIHTLLPLLGATRHGMDEQVGQLVGSGTIGVRVQVALDTLRVIGAGAAAPGMIDPRDDAGSAMGLFRLLNYMVEKAITDPKRADEMFALLPQHGKRDPIEQRHARFAAAPVDANPGISFVEAPHKA